MGLAVCINRSDGFHSVYIRNILKIDEDKLVMKIYSRKEKLHAKNVK